MRRRLGMHHESGSVDFRRDLFEQFQPFSTHRRGIPIGETPDVAVGASLGPDKTGTDWIADIHENNWRGVHFRTNYRRHQIGIGDQYIGPEIHQLNEDGAYSLGIRGGKANIDLEIAPLLPAQPIQFPPERRDLGLCGRIALGIPHQHADAPHPLALLRAHRERPRCYRATEQRDELAPPYHSMTSSARASSVGGTSRPSTLAVFRLITNSYLVGA